MTIPKTAPRIDGYHLAPALNREEWLTNVAVMLRPWFEHRGYPIPTKVRMGVGSMTKVRATRGVCWSKPDKLGFHHIVISPAIDDPVAVAATLAHELIHAKFPDDGHGPLFKEAALALGFLPPMTTTPLGDDLRDHLEFVVKRVGPYPHQAIDFGPKPKPAPSPEGPPKWKFFCPGCKSMIHMNVGRKTVKNQFDLLTSLFDSPLACSNPGCTNFGQPMKTQLESAPIPLRMEGLLRGWWEENG